MTPNPTTAPAVRRDNWAQFRDDVERTVIASGIFTKKQRQPKIDLILDSAHNHASHGATVEVGCKRREMDIHGHHAQHQVRRGADPAQVVFVLRSRAVNVRPLRPVMPNTLKNSGVTHKPCSRSLEMPPVKSTVLHL
ncbi:MAG: hypothetical protein DMF95_20645 [Acidobacteria bacterium]|nr:MAG: hypothetical protein DMF95_20645 [Acidobacteriota bacterium]